MLRIHAQFRRFLCLTAASVVILGGIRAEATSDSEPSPVATPVPEPSPVATPIPTPIPAPEPKPESIPPVKDEDEDCDCSLAPNDVLVTNGATITMGSVMKRVANPAIPGDEAETAKENAGLVPGAPIEYLHVSGGNWKQTADGVLRFVFWGPDDGTDWGQISLRGMAHFDGKLEVMVARGFVPEPGERRRLMTYDCHIGKFTAVSKPWKVEYNKHDLSVYIDDSNPNWRQELQKAPVQLRRALKVYSANEVGAEAGVDGTTAVNLGNDGQVDLDGVKLHGPVTFNGMVTLFEDLGIEK